MASGYRERRAPAALAGVVACVWEDRVDVTRIQRVLPDGCIDLIWLDGAVHVAGPDTGAFAARMNPGQTVVGVRFRPGAAPGVLGMSAVELRDRRVGLPEIWPGTALAEQVADAPDPAAALIGEVARRAADPDPALSVVLARLRAGSGVAATADALGWTERALHRRCREAFGYGPAVLRRILRFRTALRLAEQGVPFAAVAAQTGYADQAHLAREVRALAQVPLGQLIRPQPGNPQPGEPQPREPQPGSAANRSTPTPSGSSTTA
jgi:AraC-like DNA-binding protein